MAEARASVSLPGEEDGGDDRLATWQMAWINRHRPQLMRRLASGGPVMDVVDRLVQKGSMHQRMDVYQHIRSQVTIPNEKVRLLLSGSSRVAMRVSGIFRKRWQRHGTKTSPCEAKMNSLWRIVSPQRN